MEKNFVKITVFDRNGQTHSHENIHNIHIVKIAINIVNITKIIAIFTRNCSNFHKNMSLSLV